TGLYSVQRQSKLGYVANYALIGTPPAVTRGGTNQASGVGAGVGGGGAKPKSTPAMNTGSSVTAGAGVMPPPPLNTLPEEQRADRVRVKVHPAVLALIYRLKQKEQPPVSHYGGFVREGKAEVQVWLNVKSDAVRLKLKELGFEIVLDPADSKLIV